MKLGPKLSLALYLCLGCTGLAYLALMAGVPFATISGLDGIADYADKQGKWCEQQSIANSDFNDPSCDQSNIENASLSAGLIAGLMRLAEIGGPAFAVGALLAICLAVSARVVYGRSQRGSYEEIGGNDTEDPYNSDTPGPK
ncbi:MAG: hypothetical protein JSS53_03190 [Proteobacteria bacterium]|nr:hypothetical protein [Pseudomonadota bacterium]